jgi:Ran GTPase-activating protein (RanGAP) involved in mRNA processing and transport
LLAPLLASDEIYLKNLNLECNQLGDLGVMELLKFSGNQIRSIKILNLSNNNLTSVCCENISRFLRSNDSLCELYLHWNKIDYKGGESLFSSFGGRKNQSLLVLDLSHNNLGNEFNSRRNENTYNFFK